MINFIQNQLLRWYREHRRTLPWRTTPKPYFVWLSEIIMQQTRVEQGMAYYLRFTESYPEVSDLALAPVDDVLKLWQGLGYYNRARNLHLAAREVVEVHGGEFPDSYEALLSLKGVGPYTAAAIASIAFNKPHAVVDGNVVRLISRLYGISDPVDQGSTMKLIQNLATDMLNLQHPGDHNQAMMEFGALVCTPAKPDCKACILQTQCTALRLNLVQHIPFKQKKTQRSTRYFHYFVASKNNYTLLRQRGNNDIWAGLYEFPMLETSDYTQPADLEIADLLGVSTFNIHVANRCKKHVLTHRDILATFYHVETNALDTSPWNLVSIDELHTFALPRLIDRYLENYEPVSGKKRF